MSSDSSTYGSTDVPVMNIPRKGYKMKGARGGYVPLGRLPDQSLTQGVNTMADEQEVVRKEPEPTYEVGYVKAARRDGRVALWDVHPQHPNPDHEVYVADGSPPVNAAFTPEVERAIADGRLARANDADVREYEARAADREERAAEARAESKDKLNTQSAVVEPTEDDKRGPGRPRNAS